jgi:general L-amino acid transport system permease protein
LAWRRPAVRALAWQAALALAIGALLWWVAGNVATNLPRLKMELRFGFLADNASFELGDNLLGYRAGSSFAHAFAAGLGNTLFVSVIGIVLTALVGTLVALLRLSGNALVSGLAWAYVEVARNVPLLLQLLFWQTMLVRALPPPRQAWTPLPGLVVSNRGATMATVAWQDIFAWAAVLWLLSLAAVWLWRRQRAPLVQHPAGRGGWMWWLTLVPPLLLLWAGAAPLQMQQPVLRGFNLVGGVTLVPEFFALLFGLVFCHAGFAAESIRAGILGVNRGQWDAARSLGLRWWPIMRRVILPQALRIMVPPLTSNFLSLTKSSSLAVAIGYPDLLRVSTVAISETGRAVECITIILLVYLSLSLITSALMNWYNHRIALQGGRSA